ncbi:Ig-like domain-containing protein [Halorientalis pallida]|uniref:Ig-like domain-containing protein n=1 Tax=Halorientalis pallida TaxID=2479928 RepID=UPI00187D6BC9|nr:Ig-like domain-containing protein [Halorientalis pallida]
MTESAGKLRALALALLTFGSVVAGVAAFSGVGAAANTAQLDFSGIYNADVVRGTADATDGDFDNGGFTLVSSSEAQANGNPADDGVPDDGVFPAVTGVHPRFDLVDFDSVDSNAWQTTGTGSQTASVTDGQYETVHVVASAGGAGTGSPARFEVTLHYSDTTTVTSPEYTVPDWFGSPPSDPGYAVRDGMDRYETGGGGYEDANEPGIWGYAVSADASKTLTQVTIDVTENQAGSFNFFGGAATTQTSNVVNGAPTANDDSDSTDEDTSATVDVVANDNDPEGDALDVSAITNGPSHGSAQITGGSDDQIQFDPGADRTADVSITYEVDDGNGGTDTGTLSITVNPVNDTPTAADDSDSTNEDTSATVDVVANDNDVDGDALDVTAITNGPSHGTAQITGASNDRIQFDPGTDETGDVTITYEVGDGNGGTDTAKLSVTVGAVNDAPTASDDTGTTDEDTPLEVADGDSLDLLNLASDVDGDTLTLTQVDASTFSSGDRITLGSGASLTVTDDGSWTYDPNGQFEALGDGGTDTDSFSYTVGDGNGGTAQGRITLTITGVRDGGGPVDDDRTPPTADAGPDRSATVGDSVTFDGTNSSDDEELETLQWDLDDDGRYEKTSARATRSFDSPGEYAVTLRVWDESSNSDIDVALVTVSAATPERNGTVRFNATTTPTATTPESGPTTTVPDRDGSDTSEADTVRTESPTTARATQQSTDARTTAGTESPDAPAAPANTSTRVGPGFGFLATLVALLVAAHVMGRRRGAP